MSNVDVTTFPTPIAQAKVREQPHNIEAEQGLLGAILINNRAYEKVSDFLQPEHFSDPIHGRIFEACGKLIERGQIANPVTLKPIFDNEEALVEAGGANYLVQLAASVVTVVNAEDYGKSIKDSFLRRELIEIGEEVVNGFDCWIIELLPNENAPVVWGKLVMWIDKKNYMQMKTQFFDEFGDLINVMNSVEIADFGGKKLPSKIEFIPLEKEGNKTVIERLVWEFDIDINPRFFTPGYMKNLR